MTQFQCNPCCPLGFIFGFIHCPLSDGWFHPLSQSGARRDGVSADGARYVEESSISIFIQMGLSENRLQYPKKMPFPKTHVANSRKCVSFQFAELQDCAFHIGKQYSSHESVRPGEKLITPSGQRCRKQKLKQLENDIENGNQAR